ncbi:MAG TPA: PAS domain S-box protein [Pirellulaceae bacterium]|nr:PAS domain S-box protein [Pirellulaceae bacterium]
MSSDQHSDQSLSPADPDHWLRFAIDRMPAVFWTTDAELRFTSVHGAALALIGVRANSLNGIALHDYLGTFDHDFPAIAAHRVALSGQRSTYEVTWHGICFAAVVDPLIAQSGKIIGCVGIAFDITDQKQTEATLRQQYTQWEQLLTHVPAMLYQTAGKIDGSTMRVPFLSARAHELLGVDPGAIASDPIQLLDAIHPDDLPRYYEAALQSMRTLTPFEFEFRSATPSGKTKWLRAMSTPVALPNDEAIWHGLVIDITAQREREEVQQHAHEQLATFAHSRVRQTNESNEQLHREALERRQVEESLRKQTSLMNGILANMPVIAFRLDNRMQLIDAQGAGLDRLAEGKSHPAQFSAMLHAPEMREAVTTALSGGESRVIVKGCSNDTPWAFDTFLTFDSARGQGAIGFAMDVTEHDQAVRKLQQSEERWHAMADTSSDAVMLVNRQGQITYINRVVAGATMEQVIGSNIELWVPEARRPELREHIQSVFKTGCSTAYEMDGYGPNGTLAWYSSRIGPYRQAGEIVSAVLYVTDITERKRSEQARIASEKRYRLLMDSANDAIVIIDADTRCVLEANARALTVTGKSATEIAGLAHTELYAAEHAARVGELFELFALSEEGLITDVEILDAQAARVPVEVSLRWIEIDQRRLVIGILRDVAERKKAEQTLRNEERLLRELLNLQERERLLIAYEIHDGFVQDVVGAHLAMEGISAQLEAGKLVAVEQLHSLRNLLRHAIDEGRRMISELRPMIIDERGIIDAISYLINEQQSQGGPEVRFHHSVGFQRLSPLLEGTMFRIVQEALNNVQRHSQASTAEVELVQQDGCVRLIIRDAGIGFDQALVPPDRFGLRGMKERARLFGGQAFIRSQPGHGTEVAVELPIETYLAESEEI